MTTIDKIRAEIRRLYSEDSDRHIVRTSLEALSNLMDFLDTLEEPVSEDLEEAAEDFTNDEVMIQGEFGGESVARKVKKAFIAGAEWMKAKMMEGAVEGEVVILLCGMAYIREKNRGQFQQYLLDNFKMGDKVKNIIVKEEEQ